MMKRLRDRVPSHSTVAAYAALFLALGGVSYAAVNLGKDSVGSKQIKKDAVRSSEVKNKSLSCKDLKNACAGGKATTRSKTVTLSDPSCDFFDGNEYCYYGPTKVVASCAAGEHAVGGGYKGFNVGGQTESAPRRSSYVDTYSRPDPLSGTPTGWAVEAGGSTVAPVADSDNLPAPTFTVYAVCST